MRFTALSAFGPFLPDGLIAERLETVGFKSFQFANLALAALAG